MEKVAVDQSHFVSDSNDLSLESFEVTREALDDITHALKKQSHQAILIYLTNHNADNSCGDDVITGNQLHQDLGISEANIVNAIRALQKVGLIEQEGGNLRSQISLTPLGLFYVETIPFITLSENLATEEEIQELMEKNTIQAQVLEVLVQEGHGWVDANSFVDNFGKSYDVIASSGGTLMYAGLIARRFNPEGVLQFRATQPVLDFLQG